MGTRELKVLSVTFQREEKALEKHGKLLLSNFRIRDSRALGVTRPSQMHLHELAIWKAAIQPGIKELSRELMKIKSTQACAMFTLSNMNQIRVCTDENLEAILFLKENSDWNGTARIPPNVSLPRREQLEAALTKKGIPVVRAWASIP